jgi:hypothetical protein
MKNIVRSHTDVRITLVRGDDQHRVLRRVRQTLTGLAGPPSHYCTEDNGSRPRGQFPFGLWQCLTPASADIKITEYN